MKIGDKVTCKQEVKAYYSGYADRPEVIFRPGMVGVVATIDCVPIRRRGTFCCVDFLGPVVFKSNTWRVALYPDNIRKV